MLPLTFPDATIPPGAERDITVRCLVSLKPLAFHAATIPTDAAALRVVNVYFGKSPQLVEDNLDLSSLRRLTGEIFETILADTLVTLRVQNLGAEAATLRCAFVGEEVRPMDSRRRL